jgi:predicted membrane-bound dolichyl-phosphate-mannose-protein mannosyltransferase
MFLHNVITLPFFVKKETRPKTNLNKNQGLTEDLAITSKSPENYSGSFNIVHTLLIEIWVAANSRHRIYTGILYVKLLSCALSFTVTKAVGFVPWVSHGLPFSLIVLYLDT